MTWRRRTGLIGGLLTIIVLVVVRYVLFANGALYTSSEARWSNWIVVGLGVAVAVMLLHSAGQSTSERLVLLSGLVAVISTAIGIGGLLTPITPRGAIAPACAGAAVSGGAFLATTGSGGVNARSGPDESYPQVRRFAGDCTLSFDGYCIGQPELDLKLGLKKFGFLEDQRWLILHRATLRSLVGLGRPSPIFVASGVVQSQSQESLLGGSPDSRCKKYGGWSEPAPVTFLARASRRTVDLRASSSGAAVIGFGVVDVGRQGGDDIHRLSSRQVPFNVADGRTAFGHVPAGGAVAPSGPTLLVASVCLAPNVEQPDDYSVIRASNGPRGRIVLSRIGRSLKGQTKIRAQVAACSSA